jgi:hypothetical protein
LVDEVKIVVQALAVIGTQERLAGLLVVPWFVARARLHGRQDRYQTRMRAALSDGRLDLLVLAKAALADKLDRDPVWKRDDSFEPVAGSKI